jgi:hypothetical protein
MSSARSLASRAAIAIGLAAMTAACFKPAAASAQAAPAPSIVVLPPDLQDDHENPDTVEAQKKRLKDSYARLQEELQSRGLYRVLDPAPAQSLIDDALSTQAFLYKCSFCAQNVGKKIGSDLVMVSWVQKVSELILNFNVEILRVADGQPVLVKSVDMRGNTDIAWDRAVKYLVNDIAETRAIDPHYGIGR